MKCEKICDLLKSDYLDQELTAELRREIDEHLVQCPGCRSLKEELDSWRVALRGLGQREVPAVVWQNIQDKILKEHAAGVHAEKTDDQVERQKDTRDQCQVKKVAVQAVIFI